MNQPNSYRYAEEDAESIANDVLAKIKKLSKTIHIQPDPIHFALIYETLLAYDPDLVDDINQLIDSNAYNDKTAQILFTGLLSKIIQQHLPSDEFSSILSELQESIETWLISSKTNAASLSTEIEVLKDSSNLNDTLEHLKARCLPTLLDSQDKTVQLQQDVEDIIVEVNNLKKELDEATTLAKTDELTNLPNRRGFNNYIQHLTETEQLDDLSLVVFDIDLFKNINDQHGHLVGDSALRYLARTFQREIKGQDYIARTGGEEFTLILPNTALHNAYQVADNIRQKVYASKLSLKNTQQTIKLSISAGVSYFRPGEEMNDLIDRADKALYLAKANGRNRIHTERDL